MWSVISEANVFEFPRFELAMMFADQYWKDGVKLIDARKRTISIIDTDEFKLKESA